MRKREHPSIIVRRTKRGIAPASAWDNEKIDAYALDSEFELKPRNKRSWPQLKLYWSILSGVVKATDIAPTADHLHGLLKIELGYVTLVRGFDDGAVWIWPDSAALDKMDEPEFNAFMDAALKLLAERCGFDPMQALEAA